MTLPASGAISMSQVASELGIGAGGINLNLASVRSLAGRGSGAISMSDLRGKSNAVASALLLQGAQLNATASNPSGSAIARLNVLSDGSYSINGNSYATQFGRWQSGSDGANYEILFTCSNGYVTSSGLGQNTYGSLDVTRAFSMSDSSTGTDDSANFIIRQKSNPSNSTSFSCYYTATGRCFAFGTLLRTPKGDRLVEELRPNDVISSFSEPTMLDEGVDNWRNWSVASLENVKTNTTAEVDTIRHFEEAESVKINGIHSTLSHVHFVFDGSAFVWEEAGDISGSDSFVDSMLNLVPITDIEHITEPTMFAAVNVETLDTMQVKSGDTYILTHNVSA